ncbi:PX domain-containing protein [Spironucleus salmonicida]|uniref:Sorting nexin-3 n=1 Tax=Spironucleus salmonicida TaxID=348837 RepID=V6LKC3_9EUKA|nr:PX domain-containing protein [Spironucleus salmonicida]|eukprot:EST44161.1 PX domain-containing protein [Spironucleus salmonicida]
MTNIYILYDQYRDSYDNASYLISQLQSSYPLQIQYAQQLLQQLAAVDDQVRQHPQPFQELLINVEQTLQQLQQSQDIDTQLSVSRDSCAALTRQLNILTQQESTVFWGTPLTFVTDNLIQNVQQVIVDQPQTHQGQLHDFVDYRVIFACQTSSVLREDSRYFMVRRRFNDLKGLYAELSNSGLELPPLPPQKHFLMGGSQLEFIEDRRSKMQSWIAAISAVPLLVGSASFQKFGQVNGQWRFVQQGYD